MAKRKGILRKVVKRATLENDANYEKALMLSKITDESVVRCVNLMCRYKGSWRVAKIHINKEKQMFNSKTI